MHFPARLDELHKLSWVTPTLNNDAEIEKTSQWQPNPKVSVLQNDELTISDGLKTSQNMMIPMVWHQDPPLIHEMGLKH